MNFRTLALSLLAVSTGYAQTTLAQAVDEAIAHNLNLLAERHNLTIADARIITARLRPNPVLTLGLDYQDFLGSGFNQENQGGPQEGNLRVDFTLERGGKRERRTDLAQAARKVAALQLLNTTRLLVMDVQSAFVDVLLAKDNLALATSNLQSFHGIVTVNTARVNAGDLAKVELVRSKLAELQAQNAVRQAESRLRVARNRLLSLMGRTTVDPAFDVAGELRRDTALVLPDELQATALKLRPDLLALAQDQKRSQADLGLQQAQAKVDFTLSSTYHHQYGNASGRALGFFFSAPLPVFNKNQGEVERARREGLQLEARLRAMQNDVATEVRNAWAQYTASKQLLETIEKEMLAQAREVRETTEYSYRRGEASFVELLDAQRAFNDTMQSYNEARAEFARSLYLIDSISAKTVNP